MATTLTSTFDIVFDGPQLQPNEVCTLSVAALGRGTFAVAEMSVTGVNTSVLTLTRSVTGGTVAVGTVTASLVDPAVVTTANVVVPAGEDLVLTMSAGGAHRIDRFVIRCTPVGTTVAQVIV